MQLVLEVVNRTDGKVDGGSRNTSAADTAQQDGAAIVAQGPVFHGPISGQYVIPGTHTTGGTVNFNFGAKGGAAGFPELNP